MNHRSGFQLTDREAKIYQSVLVPTWFGPWAEELLAAVRLQPGDRVLDAACGTGVVTRLAKDTVGPAGSVIGLDVSAPMLAIARALTGNSRISWVENGVTDTGLASDTFDAVLSQHGYHYFPDKAGALAEFRRLLAPNGCLAISVWQGHSVYTSALSDAVERHISTEAARQQRAQRQTPSPRELASALTSAGFRDVEVQIQTLEIRAPSAREFVPLHLGSMPIATAYDALDERSRHELIDDVATALRDYEDANQLVYADSVNVALGYK